MRALQLHLLLSAVETGEKSRLSLDQRARSTKRKERRVVLSVCTLGGATVRIWTLLRVCLYTLVRVSEFELQVCVH